MKGTVTRNLRLAFGLCLLFLIISSIASFISIQNLLESAERVNHTHSAIKEAETVLSVLKNAESGQRAYLLTGDEKYLKPFKEAQMKALKKLAKVKHLLADNSSQLKSIKELEQLITLELHEIQNLIEQKKLNKQNQNFNLEKGKQLMDEATIVVKEMQIREYSLLTVRTASLNKFSTYTPVLIVFVAIVAILITAFFYNKVKYDIEVRNTLQRERELMQRKDEFLSIASHELKTPITNMKGYLQILELMTVKDGNLKYKNFISKANKQAEKLTSLVSDLLNVSKIHAGKLDYNFTTFQISEIIEDVLAFAQQTSPSQVIEVKGCLDVYISADKNRLEQVISNFISNAIKYSPNSTNIIIDVNQSGGLLEVSVTDFGIGIPAEKIDHIFNRFYRVEDKSYHASGLGIGLYIADEIIKRHNGKISVTSVAGSGSTFKFTIPTSAAKKQTA